MKNEEATRKIFPYRLSLGPVFYPPPQLTHTHPHTPPYTGSIFFFNIDSLNPWVQGKNRMEAELVPAGYNIKHVPRQSGKQGGGVAVIYRQGISESVLLSTADKTFTQFEYMDCQFTIEAKVIRFAVLYRSPHSRENSLTNRGFFDEWPLFWSILLR